MEHLLTDLKKAIFKVMEQMYFLLPDEDTAIPSGEETDTVYIGISGNPTYLLTLTFDRSLAGRMTSDLLGDDDSEGDVEIIRKGLRETANIIGGNFLLSFPEDEQRNVTLPAYESEELFPGGHRTEANTLSLTFEGRGMSATIEKVAM